MSNYTFNKVYYNDNYYSYTVNNNFLNITIFSKIVKIYDFDSNIIKTNKKVKYGDKYKYYTLLKYKKDI